MTHYRSLLQKGKKRKKKKEREQKGQSGFQSPVEYDFLLVEWNGRTHEVSFYTWDFDFDDDDRQEYNDKEETR